MADKEHQTIQLEHEKCLGITDFAGRDYMANDRREVTVPRDTAEWLMHSNQLVKRPSRSFGGFTLPKRATK